MSKTTFTVEEAIAYCKDHLVDYLEGEGIDVSPNGSFSCVNKAAHKHGDKNKSASVNSTVSPPLWKCFTCHISGDVFTMANYLHDLPMEGPAFLTETLPHVLERIDPTAVLSTDEDDVEQEQWVQLASEARKYIRSNPASVEHLTSPDYRRNYTEDFARRMLSVYPIAIKAEPIYDNPILRETTRKDTKPLLIPIVNGGNYLGTIACHRTNDAEAHGIGKYMNSPKLEDKPYIPILNLDKGITSAKRTGRLYLFEGVFNGLAALASGLRNTISILGTHVSSLAAVASTGVREVVICTDVDAPGRQAAFEAGKELSEVGIIPLMFSPPESLYTNSDGEILDYDQLFCHKEAELLEALTNADYLISLPEFLLRYKVDFMGREDISPMTKFELFLEFLSKHGTPILISKYAEAAKEAFTNVENLSDLLPRIRQVLVDSSSPLITKLNKMTQDYTSKILSENTVEGKVRLIESLAETAKKSTSNVMHGIKTNAIRLLNDFLSNNAEGGLRLYRTGFKNLDDVGDHPETAFTLYEKFLVGILGKPSHAKSMFVRSIALNLIEQYDDVQVLHFSTDDSFGRTLSWYIASLSGLPFSVVAKPKATLEPSELERVEEAARKLRSIYGNQLIVFDVSQAGSTAEIIQVVKDMNRESPEMRKVVIVDNLYNCTDIAADISQEKKRIALDKAITQYKYLSMSDADLVITTLETRKTEGRITQNDIKETGAIDFRTDMTVTVFNSYREYGTTSKMVEVIDGKPIPIIEVNLVKKKTGAVGKRFYFRLLGHESRLEPISDAATIAKYDELVQKDNGKGSGVITYDDPQEPTPQTLPEGLL